MKLVRHFLYREHGNILRQVLIKVCPDLVFRHTGICMEIGRLCQRMNSGVRSSRSVNLHRPSGEFKQDTFRIIEEEPDTFQLSLNRITRVALFLPAVIAAPVILKYYFVIFYHVFSLLSCLRSKLLLQIR